MRRTTAAILCIMMIMSTFAVYFSINANASESTGYAKIDEFINDPRWRDGATWGSRQQPKTNPGARWYGCASYCYDYARYCFDHSNPRAGTAFHDIHEIRAGDVVTVGHESNGNGHWFVVLKRSGNALYTAEGSWGGKVRIGWNYTITDSGFPEYNKPFNTGYHHINGGASTVPVGDPISLAATSGLNGLKAYISDTDAAVMYRITANSGFSITDLQKVGIEWMDANKNVIAKREDVPDTGISATLYVRYDAQQDLGIALEIETQYYYRFYGIYDGTTYYGETHSLVTLAHDYTETVVPPTATTWGYTEHLCAGCGQSYRDCYLPPLDGLACGDVNSDGSVNKKDLLTLKRFFSDVTVPIDLAEADVNADGTVNKKDLLRLKQYLAGFDVPLGA